MLTFSLPPYVKASSRAIENAYVIEAVGLASDEVRGVVVDNKVALEQIHPGYSLALLPLTDDTAVSYADAVFYADCFSYDHEIPTVALPGVLQWKQAGIRFVLWKKGRTGAARDAYRDELAAGLESVNVLRFGPFFSVRFRYQGPVLLPATTGQPAARLKYSSKYRRAEKEIHLYSLGLKQLDPLSEYLCYYRVLESASGSNGKRWLEDNLDRLPSTRFGMLPLSRVRPGSRRRTNLFTILRRRAVPHLRKLQKTMSCAAIARRFYSTNRCGIAHGESIQRWDFGPDFGDVYRDMWVVKLMARLAIADKL